MKLFAPFLALALLVSGCAAFEKPEQARSNTVLVCDTYARVLSTLAAYRKQGRLDAHEIAQVDQARPFFNEACEADAAPIGAQTLDMLEGKLFELVTIQSEVAK